MNIAISNKHQFGFQGMEQPESQYHTLFRQYDAVLGRWWSIDPEQERYASFSPYTAMGANPVNYVDPWGNFWSDNEKNKIEMEKRDGEIKILSDNATPEVEEYVGYLNEVGSETAIDNFMNVSDNESIVHLKIDRESTDVGKLGVHNPHDENGNLIEWNSKKLKFDKMPAYIFDDKGNVIGYKEATITVFHAMMEDEKNMKIHFEHSLKMKFKEYSQKEYRVANIGHESWHNFNLQSILYIKQIQNMEEKFRPTTEEIFKKLEINGALKENKKIYKEIDAK